MRAAVVTGIGACEVTEVPDPTPGPKQVVVQVAAAGICGTDLHILAGEFAPRLPIVPGHEFAGTVVAVGSEVTSPAVGTPVAVDPSLYCFECRYCRIGRNNLCENWGGVGVTVPGAAAEYVAVPAANCVVMPPTVRLADAALIEPLSCAIRGYDVLRDQLPTLGSRVLVYGAGTMGLMMLALARAVGAASVDVVDVNTGRLAGARQLGAQAARESADELDAADWDLVVDATGNAAAIQDGLARVGKGGVFLQFGVSDYDARVSIEPYRIYNQEITITGSMAVLHSYERAAAMFVGGLLDPDFFISHRLPLDRFTDAVDLVRAGTGRKVQVQP